MRARKWISIVLVASLFAFIPSLVAVPITTGDFSANATILDFEELGVNDILTNQFASQGVLFNSADVTHETESIPFGFNGSASDVATSGSVFLSKGVSTFIITFTEFVDKAGIFVIDPSELSPASTMTAFFQGGGSEVITIPLSAATSDPAPFVGVSNSAGITSLQFTITAGDPVGYDDLFFESSVPEPSSLILLGLSFFGIFCYRRQN